MKSIAIEGLVIPVYRTLPSDLYTPASIYLNVAGFSSSPSFLLESVVGGARVGRYSYIGITPKDGIVVKEGTISVDPLRAIQGKVSKVIAKTPELPPFIGGYVGYIGYDVISSFEDTVPTSNPDVLGVPDAMLFNYDNVIVFDHVRNELKVIGNIHVKEADPFSIYRALRRVNPSPFMVYFDYGDFQIIGASPELLLKVDDGIVTTCPIAGTRPRGQTPEEDERLTEGLKNNEKEKAEHRMLLDLGRNDVGKIAAPGTVSVPRLMEVERFSHVMHLASEVQGKLSDKSTSLDALRSTFPAGTLSGAPKIRAMQIIDELENEKRGPYGGVMGYISYDGNLEVAITIRTMVFKDGTAYAQAGGGIVYDSDPEAEFEETIIKSKGSLKAIDLAEKEYSS